MSTPRQRSHDGCWTCKAKRRRCDRTRPACTACLQRDIPCEGYEVRLRWGSGIASRGRFTGAEEPVAASTPFKPKGRRRDRSRERRRRQSAGNSGCGGSESTLTPVDSVEVLDTHFAQSPTSILSLSVPESSNDDERLFYQFLSTGLHTLHSTTVNDAANMLELRLPVLCQKSKALFSICVAFQASIMPDARPRFPEYFDAALNQFRAELSHRLMYLPDETLTAGLLLCSIGLVHGLPWTMHLHGMYRILCAQGLDEPLSQQTPFRTHLLEVMGVMDLPTFAIGRQNPPIGLWRRYLSPGRRKKLRHDGDVEVVSGLPRPLIDIFSKIGEGGATEHDFWNWPGGNGSLLQHQLWEAYRLAGILSIRHAQLHPMPDEGDSWDTPSAEQETRMGCVIPPTPILVSRVISCLDAICRVSAEPEERDSLILNAVHYPVFVAGLQADVVNADQKLKHIIRRCFYLRRNLTEIGGDGQSLLELLEEWWQCADGRTNIHLLAQARGLELGLH
ncbi:hypothetical protein FE257_010996 [Aspergillus nanangensis]|uniref:Zn(2)-C6 fungal-type domain-containing protein n=1 Tax=Aspergillus nanangensis TaxID=2582783 RepID=A0AAD4GSY5_ASPNN|nr:hypothetical protein FE257_010996 [Aspergillus nanangensis]